MYSYLLERPGVRLDDILFEKLSYERRRVNQSVKSSRHFHNPYLCQAVCYKLCRLETHKTQDSLFLDNNGLRSTHFQRLVIRLFFERL